MAGVAWRLLSLLAENLSGRCMMKAIFTSVALAVAVLLAAPAGEARAQFVRYSYYPSYYAPVYSNYNPYAAFSGYAPYAFAPSVYAPSYSYSDGTSPYLWSGRYYSTPYAAGYSYGRYYPYTNQYYYRYRTYPRYYGW
jgi:hypothetical protein